MIAILKSLFLWCAVDNIQLEHEVYPFILAQKQYIKLSLLAGLLKHTQGKLKVDHLDINM